MQNNSTDTNRLSEDYYRIEDAIRFLEANYPEQPSLSDLAEHMNLSEYYLQRLFKRWVGISPKRFLQYLTKEHAKGMLENCHGLLDVTYEVGLSSPGRLHDLFVTCEAVTPGEYKYRGEGLTIHYGIHASPFGECLIAVTEHGVCELSFLNEHNKSLIMNDFVVRWQDATRVEDPSRTEILFQQIFLSVEHRSGHQLLVYLRGTNFQIKVWEALMRIPSGCAVSYEDVAVHIGLPNGVRAVANAVAKNLIPVIIPCHRVIRKSGVIGDYRWGSPRKKALLGWEFASASP